MSDAIIFSTVSFSYPGHTVLEQIDLSIARGEFVAILGHNGAGKTTLMKLGLGILPVQEGDISILGTPINLFRSWEEIGYVQQSMEEFDFQFPATVEEVILMGRLSGKKGIFKSFDQTDHNAVEKALATIGISHLKDKKIGALSGGQRQKVFLAKTLASGAKILFLDEPTTAMDYNSQHAFYDLLQKLNTELGITIILITHDLGQIIQHVKRVIVLNRVIVFDGKTDRMDKQKILEVMERI